VWIGLLKVFFGELNIKGAIILGIIIVLILVGSLFFIFNQLGEEETIKIVVSYPIRGYDTGFDAVKGIRLALEESNYQVGDYQIELVVEDDGDNLVAVAEVKNSDWDKMTDTAVRRNVRRQIKQIWDYIESQLKTKKDVSSGIIFPKQPKDKERMKLIENMFEEEGIPVVWLNDTQED